MRAWIVSFALLFPLSARAEQPARSEGVATGLAVAGTLIGVGLLDLADRYEDDKLAAAGALSIVFLPSMGHWYAGEADGKGIGLRLAGGALGVVTLLLWVDAPTTSTTRPISRRPAIRT